MQYHHLCHNRLLIAGTCTFFIAFAAAPVCAASDTAQLRFVVMADSRGGDRGIDRSIIDSALFEVKKLVPQPSFVLIPGDLVTGSKNPAKLLAEMLYFKSTITSVYPANFFYAGLGNHEVMHDPQGEKIFGRIFGHTRDVKGSLCGFHGTVYFFDRGNARFFMLNNDHPGQEHTISSRQLRWVKQHIDNRNRHTFFFMHEPSYPTGYHIGNSMDVDPYRRNEFWNVVDQAPGSMVFCGHEHFYSRRHINEQRNERIGKHVYRFTNSIFQVTVGGFGGPLTANFIDTSGVDVPPIGEYHFAVVDVRGDTATVSAQNLRGKILDRFSVPQSGPR